MIPSLNSIVSKDFVQVLEKATQAAKKNADRIGFMYQFPAKIQDAVVHRTAVKFGYNDSKMRDTICLCCQMPVNTVDIPLMSDCVPNLNQSEDLSEFPISSGCSLFFSFIKMMISFLMLRFLIVDFYNILSSSIDGSYCRTNLEKCTGSMFTTTSAYNKKSAANSGEVSVVDILNFVFVIAAIVFFVIYRKRQYQIYAKIDAARQSQDDFTVLIENIPIFLKQLDKVTYEDDTEEQTFNYEQQLKEVLEEELNYWLQKLKRDPPPVSNSLDNAFYSLMIKKGIDPTLKASRKVRSITLCFSMIEMELLDKMRQEMMDEHLRRKNEQDYMKDTSKDNLDYVPNRMNVVNEQLLEMSRRYSTDNSVSFNLTHFVGKAFVSFEYQHYRDYMLKQYAEDNDFLKINDTSLKISEASSPEDVFWFNLRISDSTRLKSIASSYLILAMVLVFAFIFLMLIQVWQQQTSSTTNGGLMATILPIILTVITSIINYGLASLIVLLSRSERHKTRSEYFVSLIIKTVITQFLNTAVMYYVMSLNFFETFFNLSGTNSDYLQANGIVLKIMSLVVVSGAISIIMNLINSGLLINRILVYFKYYHKQQAFYDDFQIRVNQDIRDPQFDFAAKYTYYIMQLLTVSFYGYLVPLTVPFLILIFIVQYWVDKFNLFNRSANEFDLSFNVSRKTFKIVECSLLIVAVSSHIYSGLIKGEASVITLLSIIFAAIYVLLAILSPASVEKKLFGRFETYEQMSYLECIQKKKFRNYYWTSNPATMFVKEKNLNNPSEYIDYVVEEKKGGMGDIMEAIEASKRFSSLVKQLEL